MPDKPRLLAGTMARGLAIATGALAPIAGAADLVLYSDSQFQGRPLNVVIDLRQLGTLNFNDRASSVVVENGAWVLCAGEDFSGKCVTLEPGSYPSLEALGLDDTITSVRRRDPVSLGVFRADPPPEIDSPHGEP